MQKEIYYLKLNGRDLDKDELNEVIKRSSDAVKEKLPENSELLVCIVEDDASVGLFKVSSGKLHIKFKKLDERAEVPKQAKPGDMCFDLKAIDVEYNADKDAYIYHTGLAFESPINSGSLLFVRSSNYKTDCYLANHVGVADIAGYRGEIMLIYKNRTSFEVRCMLEEWKHMNKVSEGISFNNDDNVGETVSMMKSKGTEPFKVPDPMDYKPYEVNDRVAQIMFVTLPEVELDEVTELSESARGAGGFGHTGK